MKTTVKELEGQRDRELAELKERMLRVDRDYQQMIIKCEEFGGFVDRCAIQELLGVSAPRVSVLLRDERFRKCPFGYSLADVKAYVKNRKPGRPKKGSKPFQAEQHEMKLD
jgi:hypothetical protein